MIRMVNAFLIGVLLMTTAAVGDTIRSPETFRLRATTAKQAQALCPTPLISMYEKLHADQYYACDDGKNTTVLVFSNDKLIAIMDVKFFAKMEGL